MLDLLGPLSVWPRFHHLSCPFFPSPLTRGRNCEVPGEDPALTTQYIMAYVPTLQGNNSRYAKVISTCKHFAAYEKGKTWLGRWMG